MDAVIEPNPVDSIPAARRVAIAHLDLPVRWPLRPYVRKRSPHGVLLLVDASLPPLAIDADVQRDGVVERRARLCTRRSGGQ
jgi:hypothetical protein